jgi:hypothetical protein
VFSFVECINRQAAVVVDQVCGGGKKSFESRICVGSITSFLPAGSSCLRPSRAGPSDDVKSSNPPGQLAKVVSLPTEVKADDGEKAKAL